MKFPFLFVENDEKNTIAIQEFREFLEKKKLRNSSCVSEIDLDHIDFEIIGENITKKWSALLHSLNFNFILFMVYAEAYRNGYSITPQMKDLLNVFTMPVKNIRVVILGQDPYPQNKNNDVANGFSFSTLNTVTPPSLRTVIKEIENSGFLIQKTDNTLSGWIEQGVFLMNCCPFLFVSKEKVQTKAIDMEICKILAPAILEFIEAENKEVKFLLMGKYATNFCSNKIIKRTKNCICIGHPSPLAFNAKDTFLGSGCFNQVNELLRSNRDNTQLIDWGKMNNMQK